MRKSIDLGLDQFCFRRLHSQILIGMGSDRYAGWIGQIYSEGRYEKGITRRSHKVGDQTFNEETLPVESVTKYFEHFPLLEIDYTFYRLLPRRHAPSGGLPPLGSGSTHYPTLHNIDMFNCRSNNIYLSNENERSPSLLSPHTRVSRGNARRDRHPYSAGHTNCNVPHHDGWEVIRDTIAF